MSKSKTTAPPKKQEMKRSWLVQRLNPPAGFDNPFSFGGGLRNGGLSADAMGLLRSVFSFDYMGAAEFEWGAVPEALSRMAGRADGLTAVSMTIPLAQVEKSWSDRSNTVPSGEVVVYILCHQDDLDEVQLRILAWAAGDRDPIYSTKERVGLSDVLRPGDSTHTSATCGWLELNNGFMFFTDRTMWEQTSTLFGIEAVVTS
jgi:hypothetical protein